MTQPTQRWRRDPGSHDRDIPNEQIVPLGPGGKFTGSQFTRVDNHHGIFIYYIATSQPTYIRIVWSKDGVNPEIGGAARTNIPVKFFPQYGLSFGVALINPPLRPYYKIEVLNGPEAQGFVFSLIRLLGSPYAGSFVTIDDPLTIAYPAALTRSVIAGQDPLGNFQNIKSDLTGGIQVSSLQLKDAGNTFNSPGSPMPTPTEPWKGKPFATLKAGVIGSTFSIIGTPGKSGTIFFNYSPESTTDLVTVRVPLHITNLAEPLLIPLQNVEEYFWLEFVPDDDTGTELHISTIHHRQQPLPLVRFLNQTISDNEAVGSARAYLSARKPDGTWPAVGFGQQLRATSLPVTIALDQPPTELGATTIAQLVPSWEKFFTTSTVVTQVKTGPGVVHGVRGIGVITLYDGTSGTTGQFFSVDMSVVKTVDLDVVFTNGLRVKGGGGTGTTVIYK